MTITFKSGWNSLDNNGYFIEIRDPTNWRGVPKQLRANESNIETIIRCIPDRADEIRGDHISDVVESVKTGNLEVVKGVHEDRWARQLGKHITVQLGAPYLDTYHLYGEYDGNPLVLAWIVSYISMGIPMKINP